MVCDAPAELKQIPAKKIETNQIHIITLAEGLKVQVLERFTKRMPDGEWQKTIRQLSGGDSDDNLAVDELGPHKEDGTYDRIWVLRYQVGGGFSQRQLRTTYMVISPEDEGGGYSVPGPSMDRDSNR